MKKSLLKRKDVIEYEDAPSGAIKLYNYKEPFMDTPNGFGYLGVLMHDAERDVIQCHVCGEWFAKLANHIQKHGFKSVKEYKKEFGLSQSTALVCDGLRELMIKNGVVNQKQGKKNLKSIKLAQIASAIKKRNAPKGTYKISTEIRNNRGTCPLQLLDKLDKIKVELGRTPTHSEVWKLKVLDGKYFSGRGLLRSIEYVYGSWENAIKQLHWTGLDRKKNRKWTKESLKNILKEFVFNHKRFPYRSDSNRKIFPTHETFRLYGGIRKMKDDLLKELILTSQKNHG